MWSVRNRQSKSKSDIVVGAPDTIAVLVAGSDSPAQISIKVEPLVEGLLVSSEELPELFTAFPSLVAMQNELPEVVRLILEMRGSEPLQGQFAGTANGIDLNVSEEDAAAAREYALRKEVAFAAELDSEIEGFSPFRSAFKVRHAAILKKLDVLDAENERRFEEIKALLRGLAK